MSIYSLQVPTWQQETGDSRFKWGVVKMMTVTGLELTVLFTGSGDILFKAGLVSSVLFGFIGQAEPGSLFKAGPPPGHPI